MNPWMRLLVVLALAVAAALFLKFVPPVIVLVFFAGGGSILNAKLRGKAREDVRRLGPETLGLRQETSDPFGLLGYPFALFGRGSEGEIDGMQWGTWHGLEVKRFDFSCARANEGQRARFACAMAPVGATYPPLVVESKMLAADLNTVPMAAVDVGTKRFDAIYDVRCADAVFARALLDPEMVKWLDELGEPWGFETNGALALSYGRPTLEPAHALELLEAFLDHVPRAMRETPSTNEMTAEPSQGTA